MASEIKGDNSEGELQVTKSKNGSKDIMVSGDSIEQDSGKEVLKDSEALALAQMTERHFMPNLYVASLPKAVKRRLKALKKLQVQVNHLEAEFFEELHKLECQYQVKYQTLYDKRTDIINGKVEPTDPDCEWPEDESDPLSEKFLKMNVSEEERVKAFAEAHKFDESIAGVPEFWITIFRNVELLRMMVQTHDWPILKHLQDIQVYLHEDKSFRLDFIFGENEFFTDKVLSKTYFLKVQPDEDDPLLYEGPEVFKCKGTTIAWKQGKDVTVRLVKKVQKHKGRGVKRVLTKTVPNDSFFNFFNPPEVKEDEDMDEETEAVLEADFEIGQFFRERVIPRAVLYYTGEAVEEEEFEDEEEAGEADEDEDEEEEDEN